MPGGDDWGTAGDIILECELGQGHYIGTFWKHRRPDYCSYTACYRMQEECVLIYNTEEYQD